MVSPKKKHKGDERGKKSSKVSKKRRKKKKGGSIHPTAFIPFGVGQFFNGDHALGASLLGLELISLYTVFDAQQNIAKTEDECSTAAWPTPLPS